MISPRAKLRRARAPFALAIVLALAIPSLGGCATAGLAVVGAGTGVAIGTGVDYTLNGIAFKTFTAPIDEVKVATRGGLENMGIEITKDAASEKDENVWRIEGIANGRDVGIDLQALTPKTTRIRVVAEDGIFFKDKATEAEIIYQTADALDHPAPAVAAKKATKTPVKVPVKAKTTPVRDASRQ
jgi:hypothetical protein